MGAVDPDKPTSMQQAQSVTDVQNAQGAERSLYRRLFRQYSRASRKGDTKSGEYALDLLTRGRQAGLKVSGLSSYEDNRNMAIETLKDAEGANAQSQEIVQEPTSMPNETVSANPAMTEPGTPAQGGRFSQGLMLGDDSFPPLPQLADYQTPSLDPRTTGSSDVLGTADPPDRATGPGIVDTSVTDADMDIFNQEKEQYGREEAMTRAENRARTQQKAVNDQGNPLEKVKTGRNTGQEYQSGNILSRTRATLGVPEGMSLADFLKQNKKQVATR